MLEPPVAPPSKLSPVHDGYPEVREDLHRLAYGIVAPAQRDVTGRIGLRAHPGGFATSVFGDGRRVGVDGTALFVEHGDDHRRSEVSTLAAAAAFVGVTLDGALAEHDSPSLGDVHRVLAVDAAGAAFVADWFAFATTVLADLAATTVEADDTSAITLWPGHFDPALESGDAASGRRATYGASPGDAGHDEPYLYVGAWGEVDDDPYWNAAGFAGAELAYRELCAAEDPRAAAVAFFTEGHRRLA